MKEKPENILVIRYRFIGDTVLSVPFLRNLRYNYPDARIDMMISPDAGEFLLHCPYIDTLIAFETSRPFEEQVYISPSRRTLVGYAKFLREKNYDVVFILKRSFSSALLAFMAGIPYRVGFNTECRGFLLSKPVPYDTAKHESECFLDLLRAENIEIRDKHLESWTIKTDKSYIDKVLSQFDIYPVQKILINAATSNPKKMWPVDNFVRLILELVNNYDVQVFFAGGAGDIGVYKKIEEKLASRLKYPVVNLVAKTSILQTLELLKRMDLIIGIDSGIMHLGASVNIPTITLFGPVNELKWLPLSDKSIAITAPVSCRPCNWQKKCSDNPVCMTDISYDRVLDEVSRFLITQE